MRFCAYSCKTRLKGLRISRSGIRISPGAPFKPNQIKRLRAIRDNRFGWLFFCWWTPQEIDQFLSRHCKTPATANGYRVYFSLCYRLGMENGKVQVNQARLVRVRTEHNGRMLTVHYTPKHGSWLNQAEIEIGIFSRRCLGKRRIGGSPGYAAKPRSGKDFAAPTATRSGFSGSSPESWHG